MNDNVQNTTPEETGAFELEYDFEDTPIDESKDTEETNKVETTETETKETEKVEDTTDSKETDSQKPFMTIKFNHESIDLSQEEAVELAQKGKNYDSVNEKYESLKANETTFKEIQRLAKLNDMSVEDFIKNLTDTQERVDFNNELERLKEQYPNSDENLLKEVAENHLKTKHSNATKKEQEAENAQKQEISRQLDVFSKRYPTIDPAKLDKKVYELMKDGFTILEAYESFNADLRAKKEQEEKSQAEVKQQNEENKAKSLGNISNQESETQDDAALFGKYMGL